MMTRGSIPAGLIQGVSLRHELKFGDWNVTVTFDDAYFAETGVRSEILKVSARDPMSAMRVASYTPERTWSPDKLLAVAAIHPVRTNRSI